MRLAITRTGFTLWLSASDTYDWAHRSGQSWPGSQLSGRRIVAEYDDNGLLDLAVDGRDSDDDLGADELNAIVHDHLIDRLPALHPAWDVTVGQFRDS